MGTCPRKKPLFGGLGASLLLGMGCGFVPHDMHAGADGHVWNSSGYLTSTIIATVIGGLLGLAVGRALELTTKDLASRRKIASCLWICFFCCLVMYGFIRPAVYGAR